MKPVLICLMTLLIAQTCQQNLVHGLWLFQNPQDHTHQDMPTTSFNDSFTSRLANIAAQQLASQFEQAPQQQDTITQHKGHTHASHSHTSTGANSVSGGKGAGGGAGYSSYGSGLLSIAGIQPASLSALLGTVGDTSFRYFNIQDQCRNRAACDLGAMLYKKLSFVHNWLVRTSVRSLVDMNNVYMQSWMEGMTGRNCTAVYVSCHQSPLEGLMNLAMIQNLVY